MSECTHGNLTAHGRECPWCKNEILKARIEALEAQLTALREAVQDYLDYDSESTYEVLAALLEVSDE